MALDVRAVRKLAMMLRADADDESGVRFDYSEWGSVGDESRPMSCGTTACALGLAAVSGKFPGLGFVADGRRSINFTWQGVHVPASEAAKRAFGTTDHQFGQLFLPSPGEEIHGAVAELAVAAKLEAYADKVERDRRRRAAA